MKTFVILTVSGIADDEPMVLIAHGSKDDLIKGVIEKVNDPAQRQSLLDAIEKHQEWGEGRHYMSSNREIIISESDSVYFPEK